MGWSKDHLPDQKNRRISRVLRANRVLLWIIPLISISGLMASPPPAPKISPAPGNIYEYADVYGYFYSYSPPDVEEHTKIIVLIHGTPAKETTAEATASYYLNLWRTFAKKNGYILISPAFNQENFSSREGDHALGGYRGLFGRNIPADEWVLRLVKAFQDFYHLPPNPFFLYGHSAGGQFVGRFLIMHPEEVFKAVISSAATYPQPNPDIPWPFGMTGLNADIVWDETTTRHINIYPEKKNWLAATQVPSTVIVGLNDTSELPLFPGQKGNNRFTIAQNWVADMKKLAEENGVESRIKIEIIPGKGHSMSALIPYTQKSFLPE